MDHLHDPLRRRYKVRVEDGDKLSLRHVEPLVQGSSFITVSIAPVKVHDGLRGHWIHSAKPSSVALDDLSSHLSRLVGRIVEDLNLEPVPRILQPAHRLYQPVDDELLVEDGQLNRDEWKLALGKLHRRLAPFRCFLLVPEVEPHQLIPVNSIERQDDHDDEVRNQYRCIEGIPPVKAMEVINPVGIVRLPVMAKAPGGKQQPKQGRQCVRERGQVVAPAERSRTRLILRDRMPDPALKGCMGQRETSSRTLFGRAYRAGMA